MSSAPSSFARMTGATSVGQMSSRGSRFGWLPTDVSGQAIRSYPRAVRIRCEGGRYAPKSGLVLLTSSFVDPDPGTDIAQRALDLWNAPFSRYDELP